MHTVAAYSKVKWSRDRSFGVFVAHVSWHARDSAAGTCPVFSSYRARVLLLLPLFHTHMGRCLQSHLPLPNHIRRISWNSLTPPTWSVISKTLSCPRPHEGWFLKLPQFNFPYMACLPKLRFFYCAHVGAWYLKLFFFPVLDLLVYGVMWHGRAHSRMHSFIALSES